MAKTLLQIKKEREKDPLLNETRKKARQLKAYLEGIRKIFPNDSINQTINSLDIFLNKTFISKQSINDLVIPLDLDFVNLNNYLGQLKKQL